MKKLIFILALLLPAVMSQAMSVNGLFKKYKKFPEAQYVRMNEKELRAQADSVDSEEEKEVLLSAKGMQMLLMHLDDDSEKAKLLSELNSLKGYSLALSFTHNNGNQSVTTVVEGNVSKEAVKDAVRGFYESFIDPTIAVDVYGKYTSDECITQPLFLLNFWGFTGLVYIDGKIKASDADKVLKFTVNTDTSVKVESVKPQEEEALPDE